MGNKYDNPFLKEVITRLDFASPFSEVKEHVPQSITKKVLSNFPISEPKQYFARELQISPAETKEKKTEGTHWFYHGKEKEKTLCLSTNFLWISYKKYQTFEVLLNDFLIVTASLFESDSDLQVNRFGLRYINDIQLTGNDVFDWNEYLSDSLLASFDIPDEKEKICRVFNNLTLNYGDMIIAFHYGVFNPDFPALVRKKAFILDYDAYYQGPMGLDEIKLKLGNFHEKIEHLFESHVKYSLRQKMGLLANAAR